MPGFRFKTLLAPAALCAAACAAMLLSGCTSSKAPAFQRETFEVNNNTYSRSFEANEAQTCEAARRALLSQGYVLAVANADLVNARKSFQTESDVHIEIDFRVVCTAHRKGARPTIAFVTALQERYTLKKSNNSASVGVGAIGSLSLPFTSGDDSLVKVASETITAANFYDRFFKLLTSYLVVDADAVPAAAQAPVPAPAPIQVPPMPIPPTGAASQPS